MAFKNIDKLKQNGHILVTKAISWLLRDLIKHHRQKVETYLKDNENTLPRIAIRETRTKLLTGKKTPR
jgi:3-methyladenine DNA glycosylase AlkD